MQQKRFLTWLTCLLFLGLSVFALAHAAQQNRTLVVTGHAGELVVVEMSGRSYVEIEALARLANGSLSFKGNQIVLTLPSSTSNTQMTPAEQSHPSATGFTKEFLRAGLEQMSVIREWRTTLISAVQRGFPVTEDWMATFSRQAQHELRVVSLAASSDSDRNALQLLTNEFNHMKKLSDRFVEANKSRTYVSPTALDNDALDQKILNCAHSLAAMAASGQFVDDGSCQ
jgi:hypothetical protein